MSKTRLDRDLLSEFFSLPVRAKPAPRPKPDRRHVLHCLDEAGNDVRLDYDGDEVSAPSGHHFDPDGVHVLVCHGYDDAVERLQGQRVVRCGPDCEWWDDEEVQP